MLEGYTPVRHIVLACGTVDLCKGIDGLAMIIRDRYKQNPFEKGTLFLFCGRRSDRHKKDKVYLVCMVCYMDGNTPDRNIQSRLRVAAASFIHMQKFWGYRNDLL